MGQGSEGSAGWSGVRTREGQRTSLAWDLPQGVESFGRYLLCQHCFRPWTTPGTGWKERLHATSQQRVSKTPLNCRILAWP